MTVLEFLDLVKKEPKKWIRYCEIFILENGSIELARPSHTEKIIDIYCNNEEISREEFNNGFLINLNPLSFICEKYSIISVWYDFMIGPSYINRFQQRSIELLKRNNLICRNPKYEIATEYSWYLENREYVRRFLKEK